MRTPVVLGLVASFLFVACSGAGSTCDATKLPTADRCVVSDAHGIFVSSGTGSAGGAGTMASPMSSLDAGIAAARAAGKRVYACAETYAEQITLQEGVSVFGYFDCRNAWAIGSAHAKVQPAASPVATATGVASATRIEAVDLVAPDFTTGSQSSIGLIASSSPGLYLAGDVIHAGTGGAGDAGADGIQLTDSGNAKNGASSWADGVCTGILCPVSNYAQPPGGTNACTGEAGHDGGPGGAGGYPGEYQSVFFVSSYIWNAVDQGATAGYPTTATPQTAQGGALAAAGQSGASGAAGSSGSSGAAVGVVSASGYAPGDGTGGTAGAPGQGGGGAGGDNSLASDYPAANYAGDYAWGEPGAGGGAGGCPGLPAQPGKGGGASIAVVSVASAFTLDTVTLQASAGGAGGAAGAPSSPAAGGLGGTPAVHTVAGGAGGAGGQAGVSGNGGGGPSIGLAFQGVMPTLSASTIVHGPGGAGVAPRTVNGQTIPASADGLGADTYGF